MFKIKKQLTVIWNLNIPLYFKVVKISIRCIFFMNDFERIWEFRKAPFSLFINGDSYLLMYNFSQAFKNLNEEIDLLFWSYVLKYCGRFIGNTLRLQVFLVCQILCVRNENWNELWCFLCFCPIYFYMFTNKLNLL